MSISENFLRYNKDVSEKNTTPEHNMGQAIITIEYRKGKEKTYLIMALPARSFTKEEGQELEMGITAMLADVAARTISEQIINEMKRAGW